MNINSFKEKTLFEECLEALGDKNITILSIQESDQIFALLNQSFPMTSWGKIDWNVVDEKITINSPDKIRARLDQSLPKPSQSIYILWNDASYPVIKSNLNSVIANFDDVTSVAPDTWFLNETFEYVVEFFHEGELTMGLASKKSLSLVKSLQECFNVLNKKLLILSKEESQKVVKLLKNKFGFKNIPVNWDIISTQLVIKSHLDIVTALERLNLSPIDTSVYLLWNDSSLPTLKTDLSLVIAGWDTITNAGSLLYIFNTEAQYVIEFKNNQFIIGLAPKR